MSSQRLPLRSAAYVLVTLLISLSGSSASAQVTFANASGAAGIEPYTILGNSGGGVAAADFDQDGDIDIFVPNGTGAANQLYRNLGNGTYEEIAADAGLADTNRTRIGLWLDYDGDQMLDLLTVGDCFVANCSTYRTVILYRQVSNAVFVDVTAAAGLEGALEAADDRHAGGAAAGDLNGDGFLDLFLVDWSWLASNNPDGSRLYYNDGAGGFVDSTTAAGLVLGQARRWQPVIADLNGDGALDIYSAVDFSANQMWINQGGGTFVDLAPSANADNNWNDMGVAPGDPDNDGDLDLYVTNIEPPTSPTTWSILLQNVSTGGVQQYTEIAQTVGIDDGMWGWGATWLDADNDGWLDLAHTNGSASAPYNTDEARFYLNGGVVPLSFSDISASSRFQMKLWGSGLISFDYDRDGDLDLFQTANNSGAPALLIENTTPVGANNYLVIRPRMNGPNHWAIGSVVRIEVAGTTMMRPILAGSSFLSQEPAEAHFGLGTAAQADTVTVEWPNGTTTLLTDVTANQVLVVEAAGGQLDSDGDGLIDADETALGTNPFLADSDGDGINDLVEVVDVNAPVDTDGDLTIDALDFDDDGDGVDTVDEDTNGNGNPRDDDADGDAVPDYLDTDSDGDGVLDGNDNCRVDWNPTQSDLNLDGIGDFCQPDDDDGDGWPDSADNCPEDPNPDQADSDDNGVGDVCDGRSMARIWNERLLEAIRNDLARPTVHARNLYHVSAAMWDAWAAYDLTAAGVIHDEVATAVDVDLARDEAIAYAAYRVLVQRFTNSVGASESLPAFDAKMAELGYDINVTTEIGPSPAAVGNRVAASVIAFGAADGSNEANDYANLFYEPVNPPLLPKLPGNPDIIDANRWQPLALDFFIDQSGNPIPGGFPEFLSPEWGVVTPFALSPSDLTIYNRDGYDYWVYHDPGPPPALGGVGDDYYKFGAEMVAVWSSHLDPSDGVLWDISPGSIGNSPLPAPEDYATYYDVENGGDWGTGHPVNPVTGQPYVPQIVPRGDYARVLAEFWADGPESETPPGHWYTIANYVSDHPLFEKRMLGQGPIVDDLEWDVKLYLMLGGAMHDVAIAAWGAKGWYDYVRPISAIRHLADNGQSSDPGGPSYDPQGIPLRPGYIEVVTAESSAPGERHENLAGDIGKIAILAWQGPDYITNEQTDTADVGWILAENWWPYQRPTFVTPPFAGYVSGHSTYSRAASELLTIVTGSPYFPGGLGEFPAPQNRFLVFEDGPSETITLQWATYHDASDQTSLSRIWGGIHPPADDLPGRIMGETIARDAIDLAQAFFGESVPPPDEPDIRVAPPSLDLGQVLVDDFADASVTITNVGSQTLVVSDLSTTNATFTVLDPPTPFNLAYGSNQVVTVRFSPTAEAIETGDLEITSNDPNEGLVLVPLSGEGVQAAALRVNVGGADFTDGNGDLFVADQPYVPGSFGYVASDGGSGFFAQDIAGTTDDTLYQNMRASASLSYLFDGLVAGSYDVTLYFTEPYWTAAGQRLFDVDIEGIPVLTSFDIILASGGPFVAHSETFTVDVLDGQLNIDLTGVVSRALLSAVSVVPSVPPPDEPDISVAPANLDVGQVLVGGSADAFVTITNDGSQTLVVSDLTTTNASFTVIDPPTPFNVPLGSNQVVTVRFSPTAEAIEVGDLEITSNDPDEGLVLVPLSGEGVVAVELRVNVGGADFTDGNGDLFVADQPYVPGSFGYVASDGGSGFFAQDIAGTTDDTLYQNMRASASLSYLFDGLVAGSYDVTLYFTEPFWSAAGQRLFDVDIEGTPVLTSFDIVLASGGPFVAHSETFTVDVLDGQLNIDLTGVVNRALISAVSAVGPN